MNFSEKEIKDAQEWVFNALKDLENNPKFTPEKYWLWFQPRRSVTYKAEKLIMATHYLDEAYPNAKKQQLTLNVRLWALQNGYLTLDSLKKCVECGEGYAILSLKKATKKIEFSDYCSRKCSQRGLAKKQSSQEFIQKKKKTVLEKWGSEKAAYHDTMKKTIQEKYGVDNVSKLAVIKQKKIETSRKKYGTDFPWQTDEGKIKQKQGIFEKYGVRNVSQHPEIKKKKEETTKIHYGVENPFQSDEIKEKIKETNLKQFGVDNPSKRIKNIEKKRQMILEHRKYSDNPSAWGYNKKACKIIQQFNDLWGYNFQHAENGGEVKIGNYYVDGYDKDHNIIMEIDESYHYHNGQLKEEDVLRQKEIEQMMDCKFIRIRLF